MPYSMADETAMAMWIDEFKKTQWLTVKTLDWSDRRPGVPFETKQVSYHCTGCKNFYRDLLATTCPCMRSLLTCTVRAKRVRSGAV